MIVKAYEKGRILKKLPSWLMSVVATVQPYSFVLSVLCQNGRGMHNCVTSYDCHWNRLHTVSSGDINADQGT